MLRPSRRLSIALLWLAVLLLPLRAGAVLLMPSLMSAGLPAMPTVDAPMAAVAAMPCHAVAMDAADDPADAPQTCSYCDLCQANAPHTVWCAAVLADLLNAAPSSPPQAIASAVPDSLFRPPRSVLA
jgi:hypothetical protein